MDYNLLTPGSRLRSNSFGHKVHTDHLSVRNDLKFHSLSLANIKFLQ